MSWLKENFAQNRKPMALPVAPPDDIRHREHPPAGIGNIDHMMTEETAQQEKERHPDISYLGAGGYGLAVDLGEGKVGKYMNSSEEAEFVQLLLDKGGDVPGFAKVYDLTKIQKEQGKELWLAVVEKIQLLSNADMSFIDVLRGGYIGGYFMKYWNSWVAPLDFVIRNAFGDDPRNIRSDVDYVKLHNDYTQLLNNVYEIGAIPHACDVHAANIGWNSEGELVLFDFSEMPYGMYTYENIMAYEEDDELV